MEKKETKILKLPITDYTPADVAISIHLRNLFATYGEDKVRASLKELFGMDSKHQKKVA
jgi:hypothetical protein